MNTAELSAASVSPLLAGLFTNKIAVEESKSSEPIGAPRVVATYVDNEGHPRFGIVCDLALANSLGAALTLIPVGGAEDATAAGTVPENIADNLHEVFNICAAIFADTGNERIVLDRVHLPGESTDADYSFESLVEVDLDIDRYTTGRLSLVAISKGE